MALANTLTGDNDKEFSEHVKVAQTLQVHSFFDHPTSRGDMD